MAEIFSNEMLYLGKDGPNFIIDHLDAAESKYCQQIDKLYRESYL